MAYQVLAASNAADWVNATSGAGPDEQSARSAAADGTLRYRDPTPVAPDAPRFYRIRLLP